MGAKRVYFFCYPQGPADRAGYQHQTVCLAEGFRELGIPFSGNVDYWEEGHSPGDFLIRHDPAASYRDADIVVFSNVIYGYDAGNLLPPDLFNTKRSYRLVFIDAADGLITPGFREEMRACDMVLKCHYNRKYGMPDTFRPWAFGLSSRIIDQLAAEGGPREPEILSNYRVEHFLRQRAAEKIMPLFYGILSENRTQDAFTAGDLTGWDRLMWVQSGRRHYPAYYSRLLASTASSCFGGFPEKSITHRPGKLWSIIRRLDGWLSIFPFDRIYQFDSWRLWEAWAAGACVFHVDFDKYGCVLPVMPVNMVHYAGFNLDKPEHVAARIRNDPSLLRAIGKQGRQWALTHYSPRAAAQRLLDWVDELGRQ